MKKITLAFLLVCLTLTSNAQVTPSLLFQSIDVTNYQNKNYEINCHVYIEDKAKNAGAIPVTFILKEGKTQKTHLDISSGDNYRPGEWYKVSLSGKIDKQIDKLSVGVWFSGKGKYYFDDFRFIIKNNNGDVEVPVMNNGFEKDSINPWLVGNFKDKSKIKLTTDKFKSGKQSLLIDNSLTESEEYGGNTKVGKYAIVNGVKLYYEIYGTGEPLLLIHGNNMSIASFYKQIPELSKKYMVIALDSRGQGNSSADSTRLTYELFADDVAKFLDFLHIESANVLGWSDGGNIGVILAMRHPNKVKKLASMAAVLYNDNTSVVEKINPMLRKQLAEMESKGVAKTDMNYRLKKLLLTEPHVNPESLTKIKIPVLVMAGENDVVKKEHTALIAKKILQSTLITFKKAGHEAPTEVPVEFNKAVLDFLQGSN